ncbi:ubinuclein-2a isoform X2 [Poecilia reticulata]|uniref:ubinuclein-2a isoform X2 n=1 Tax=Poecilia reticulata TaxID=8081 RepID=UPI0004A344C1|nr:PREDICTED: ubinuclein-2 isoform X2 [Poecilia reticulata]
MAEPRKVQFVTLSAFAAGTAAESRKRRLDEEADLNFDRAGEDEAGGGAGGSASNGRLGKTGDRDKAAAERRATVRLNLSLSEPDERTSAEFNYGELIQNLQTKSNLPSLTSSLNRFNDDEEEERERLEVEALAKKFENKYYDELVPASLTTKLGGFYINTGTLQFRAASDSEGEEDKKLNNDKEQAMKKKKKNEVNCVEEKNLKMNKVTKQGVTALNLHRPEKKKRKKLMKDSLYLAAMLRRFTREKEEMKKRNPSVDHLRLAAGTASKPQNPGNATHLPLASNSTHLQGGGASTGNLSLTELTSDPAVMSLLGSANEKELQDLLGDLDFSLLDTDQQHAMATARENGILGIGVPSQKAVGGSGQGRSLGSSGGLFSPPPLPDGLPAPLIKRIEDLRAASRQFDQEGRKKFFTLDMNNILLDIELQVQEQPPEIRSDIYSHMEAFVPCNKEALLKRLKKLSLNIQDDRLRAPLLKLKLAVCSVMPEQIAKYNMEFMAKVAKQQSEEGDRNGSEEEDDEKPGKRVMGPRKKFIWDDKLRTLLCNLVRVKLSCYEMENQCTLSVEDYLKAFLENEVKPLWPKGWMQTRILFKESLAVHGHLTGNLVRRRVVPGPKPKAKDGLWINKLPLTMTSNPTVTSTRQPPLMASPPEPICLSDSLDEDLTAPSLDSISHALALLSNASKGLGLADSPMSPPPLQMPTSSPPPVAPHYPAASQLAASQLAASAASTLQQHSLVKAESAPLPPPPPAASVGNLSGTSSSTSSSSSSSTSPVVSSMARLHTPVLSLASRTADCHYGQVKGCLAQTQRHVTMVTPSHRPQTAMGKMHPHPSPSPPKQRPPPTASPLLPPHQKGFTCPAGILGALGGVSKSTIKPGGIISSSSSNGGGALSGPVQPPSSSSPSSQHRSNSTSHHVPQSFHPPSPAPSSSPSPTSQSKPQSHHHHQANFITPMQATLTKSSHSSNSSPIIKLTPRPPAPTPPPSSSPSSSPSHQLSHQQHQYASKTPKTFRTPFSVSGGGPVKPPPPAGCSFVQKPQPPPSSSANSKGEKTPASSTASVSANQRQRVSVGGAIQSSKAGNGWAPSGTLATSATTSHLSQVSAAGSPLLTNHSALPLGFGMLGGLVPVSLPFQFPPLLNFSAPGAASAASMGSTPSSNSGYPLAQSDLMDLYKSLQSGSQAALPPHLQLAFSDSNQSQSGDMKRKTH